MGNSPCQIYECDSCDHYSAARCPGCVEGNLYLEKRGMEGCGIYNCTTTHNVSVCGDCKETSCEYARRTEAICPLRSKFENRRWWAGRLARHMSDHKAAGDADDAGKISDRTIDRMRWYLVALDSYASQGIGSVSSWQLAQRVGVKAPLIRKDLSRFGEFGTPSLGYDVRYLRRKILDILRLNESRNVIWIGAQKLREHLGEMQRITQHNCHVVAVLDPDPNEVGKVIDDVRVAHLDNLQQILEDLSVDVAVVALQSADAQKVTNILARAGVTALLNMTPSLLTVPEHVTVRNLDVGGELLALSYYCGKTAGRK